MSQPNQLPALYPARAIIDLPAISHNIASMTSRVRSHHPQAQVMAVVKANAYGHGLVPSARAALQGGATWLGVAQASEALALRSAGVPGRILTWLYAPGVPFAELLAADIDVSVAAPWAAHQVIAAARDTGVQARVHVKVDTGLGRNGATLDHVGEILDPLLDAQRAGLVSVTGVWSHFAFADEPDHPTVVAQAHVFDQAIALFEREGAHLEVRHLANSAATLTNPAATYDLVRPGLAVYGLSPVPHLGGPEDFDLRPAMTLEADVATVKDLPAGHGVSYAHHYLTQRDTRLAVLPVGYADGIPRHASGAHNEPGGPIALGGKRLAIAGRVCMDQVVVDIGDLPVVEGDRAVLFGDPSAGVPGAQDWADAAGTISYEITTRLADRVPRIYLT